jgi:type I restriction enzyme, S subunit
VEPLLMPLPSLSDQEEITLALTVTDRKLRAEESHNASLDILFKSLIHNLMTGKVRVNDLDLLEVDGVV